ncbi:hypothetical protein [Sorangium sp. So ce1182]|uniref:hypothetical protein n=1 Tax=Sorangium sp. So ce1182 TaxID=3133334 RepID=UPI003F5E5725
MVGATVVLVAAASCNQVAGIREGLPGDGGCITVSDCKSAEPACRTAVACQDGACVFEDAAEGKPLAEQAAGDCALLVCDGAGSARQVPLPTDVADDGKICTIDRCDGTTPVHTLADAAPCYTGPAETRGKGLCREGTQRCDERGNPLGTCEGQVLPQQEVCASDDDEDCDGDRNEEGDDCTCGDGSVSPGEECDDGGTADGDACAASCVKERVVKIAAGYHHTCAVLNTGKIKCWGSNGSGQLGLGDAVNRGNLPDQMGSALPVTDLGDGAEVESIAAGASHTCARLTSGVVKCWGTSPFGALGLGAIISRGAHANEMGDRLEVVNLNGSAIAMAAGGNHTCAVVSGAATRCWGQNQAGQLGLGDVNNRNVAHSSAASLGVGKVALSLALGEAHTCARLNGGSVKCWGLNNVGQLGLGDALARGDVANEMGDTLRVVDLGGEQPLALATGAYHTCALLRGGRVKCWGHNARGQLGIGDNSHRGASASHMGDNLAEVDVGATVTAIAAGGYHTCALLTDGRAKCWGQNDFGQLGLSDMDDRGDAGDEMGDALPAVDLGEGATARAITAGAHHTCALLTDDRVKCWGRNDVGQLGLGDARPRGDELGTMGDALPAVDLATSP